MAASNATVETKDKGQELLIVLQIQDFGVGSAAHSASAQSRLNPVGECVVCMTEQAVGDYFAAVLLASMYL